ncbi:MAG: hypothetical protein P8X85_01150 [Desulfobacterales bacterium]
MRSIKILVLFFIMFLFSGEVFAAADSADDININVQTFQLANGMLFLVVERPATPQVACRLAIRAGSALEETGKTGIAQKTSAGFDANREKNRRDGGTAP